MSLFMLYYKGEGPRPEDELEKVRNMAGVEIVNEKLPRGIALKITSDLAKHQIKKMGIWSLYESQQVKIDNPWDYLHNSKGVPPLRLVENKK